MESNIKSCVVTQKELMENPGPCSLYKLALGKGAPFLQDFNEIPGPMGDIVKSYCKYVLVPDPSWNIEIKKELNLYRFTWSPKKCQD